VCFSLFWASPYDDDDDDDEEKEEEEENKDVDDNAVP